jgi:hypothetical protein
MSETTCAECGATITKFPSQLRERNFCDRACQGKYRSKHYVGERAAHWKGGIKRDRDRVLVYAPDNPMADSRGYVYRYRLVAADLIGRPLTQEEIVHHLDGDETNDDPENLAVITQSEHARFFDARRPRRKAA